MNEKSQNSKEPDRNAVTRETVILGTGHRGSRRGSSARPLYGLRTEHARAVSREQFGRSGGEGRLTKTRRG